LTTEQTNINCPTIIFKQLDDAPPLSPQQRAGLAALFDEADDGDDAA